MRCVTETCSFSGDSGSFVSCTNDAGYSELDVSSAMRYAYRTLLTYIVFGDSLKQALNHIHWCGVLRQGLGSKALEGHGGRQIAFGSILR
jgi:hypothetical protein